MSKILTLELSDDQTFNARITHDGRVIATASGNVGLVTATGAVREFACILGALAAQHWHQTTDSRYTVPAAWEIRPPAAPSESWMLHLPSHGSIAFQFESAAISGRAYLRPIWHALVQPPSSTYEAFVTDGSSWGFLSRDGLLHAGFRSREEAQGHADKMHDRQKS